MALSVSFIRLVSSTNVTQATRLRPSTSVGLAPTEQTSLCWTHSVANSKSGQNPLSSSVLRFCRERSCRGLREQHNKPSYLERRSRRGCHLRLTCHDEPYDLAFDYSAPGSRLPNEGLTDVLDHGSHGNDCKGRA